MSNNKERLRKIKCEHTVKYGFIPQNPTHFNDYTCPEFENNNFKYYRVRKVRIFLGKYKKKSIDIPCINGIQFFYINILTKKEHEGVKHFSDKGYEDQKTFELQNGEYLNNLIIRIDFEDPAVTQLGFTTNKGRKIDYGSDKVGELIKVTDIEGVDSYIFGSLGCLDNNLMAFGVFYYNYREFCKMFNFGYFALKFLLQKDENFSEQCEKNITNEVDKVILRVCRLPDNQFTSIMKYCIE